MSATALTCRHPPNCKLALTRLTPVSGRSQSSSSEPRLSRDSPVRVYYGNVSVIHPPKCELGVSRLTPISRCSSSSRLFVFDPLAGGFRLSRASSDSLLARVHHGNARPLHSPKCKLRCSSSSRFFIFDPLTISRRSSSRLKRLILRASSNSEPRSTVDSPKNTGKKRGPIHALLAFPKSVWNQIAHPLSDFGFGKRSMAEAGLGLFLVGGIVLLGISLIWVKGAQLRARSRKYYATFEFSKAWGITVGTPVRIRGVDVGGVIRVKPTLEKLDVEVQMMDANLVIPRNALVEVNQSGLVSETLIDITPQYPIPNPTYGPLHPECKVEGLIVCDRQRIRGEQGVSLDELVGICTKLARQIDAQGVNKLYDVGERVSVAVEEAKPLLAKVQSMANDIEPLIKEIREGGLLKDFEKLTKVAAEAGQDLRKLNNSILTPENTELLRQSVSTLTKTLKHIEGISEDISALTGDAGTRYNLKQLIQSLSRLVAD